MKPSSEEMHARMTRAAEMRACGWSWTAIGKELNCDERSCRRWRTKYPEAWQQLFRNEEEDLHEHLGVEAAIVLKQTLRGPDVRLAQNSAKFLYGQRRATCRMIGLRSPAPGESRWAPILEYLDSLTEDEVRAFVEECLGRWTAQPRPLTAGGGAAADPPAGG